MPEETGIAPVEDNSIVVYVAQTKTQLEESFGENGIANHVDYETVENIQREAVKMIKQVENDIRPEIKTAHGLWKSLIAKEKKVTEPLEELKKLTSGIMGAYNHKLQLEEEAERKRLQQIEREKQEAIAKQQAVDLAKAGEFSTAQLVTESAKNAPAPVVEAPSYRPTGGGSTATRASYSIEITEANAVPNEFWVIDEKAILEAVRKAKGEIEIAGVKVTTSHNTHTRKG